MSMMLLEAAALGAPLVCSDIAENRHVLGERALYFRSGNADDLREKLVWALAHPDEMVALAAEAREHIRREYSWDAIAVRYEELYLRIAGRHD
jgi:glycosyltransferase involved in cell wall biosynthesis